MVGFCDSDWGGSEDDMRSTSGYAFTLGSGIFSWASVKQQSVALSTAEAEYVSAADATSQAIWLRFVLKDFGEMQVDATPLMCDNTSAIAMTRNHVFHQRTKHIKRKYHFIREALQENVIELFYCKSEEKIADIFTKALSKERFVYLRELLGVQAGNSLKGNVGNQTVSNKTNIGNQWLVLFKTRLKFSYLKLKSKRQNEGLRLKLKM